MGINRGQRIVIMSLCLWVCLVIPMGNVMAAPAAISLDDSQELPVSLAGQWQFYWGQLLTPADFAAVGGDLTGGATIAVPSSWAGQVLGAEVNAGQALPYFGVSTYRKKVELAPAQVDKNMILMIESIGSAYRIWVNGTLVGGLGTIATPTDTSANDAEVPQIRLNLLNITPKTQHLDIVVQVSNNSFRESGIFGDVLISTTNAMVRHVFYRYILQDLLLIGVFMVVGLYHVMIYLLNRRERELLWLAGVCVSVALRTFLLNKFMVHLIVSDISWTILMYLQYTMRFMALFTYIQLIRTLYRQDVKDMIHHICVAVWIGTMLYVISTSPRVFTLTFNIQTLIAVIILFYYLFVVGYTIYLHNREGSRLNVFSMVFIIIAIIHDFYLYTNRLQSVQIVPFAILTTLLTQAIIISYRYTQFQQRNVQLAQDLQDTNRNLEAKVITRTNDLNVSNSKLVALTNQRSLLMANIAHDMGSPMVGMQSSLHILTTESLDTQDKQYLYMILTRRLNYVKRLVDDLFRLAKLESRQLEFNWEQIVVTNLYPEIHTYFEQFVQSQNRILLATHTPLSTLDGATMVRVDRQQLYRVLQNLIDNAVKYSTDIHTPIALTSVVRLSIATDSPGYEWHVEVVDQGIGIAAEHLPMIFERFYTRSNGLVGGSGLGLAICKEIIERHGGVIGVHSVQGQGSTFFFTLPLTT
jgi:signal transduction histidine kinase